MATFITIISGVSVFIISQYVLEFIIKPKMKLREKIGVFSSVMLLHHAEYNNGVLNEKQRNDIKKASTELLGAAWLTYKSDKKRKNYVRISKDINFILAQSNLGDRNIDYREISNARKRIEKLNSNIIITYQH